MPGALLTDDRPAVSQVTAMQDSSDNAPGR